MKHNNIVVNAHFKKDWQNRVKTWFNQAGAKKTRRAARERKAARVFPRPTTLLRPVVHGCTKRYNAKLRLGRGFTLAELSAAGFNRHEALSLGVAVDHRRQNHSVKSLRANVRRLLEYKAKLVIAPRNAAAPKEGEVALADVKKVGQFSGALLPIQAPTMRTAVASLAKVDKDTSAYRTLRDARMDAKYVGHRANRAAAKAEKEKQAAAAKKR